MKFEIVGLVKVQFYIDERKYTTNCHHLSNSTDFNKKLGLLYKPYECHIYRRLRKGMNFLKHTEIYFNSKLAYDKVDI
jgi:hypothetical protein